MTLTRAGEVALIQALTARRRKDYAAALVWIKVAKLERRNGTGR